MVFEFVVAQARDGWVLSCSGERVSLHGSEFAALREADVRARGVHKGGDDARILVRGSSGRLYLERSYGRHPLIARGGELAGAI